MPDHFDILQRPVKKDSLLAVAFRQGNMAELRVGRVVGFTEANESYYLNNIRQETRPQIIVEWMSESGWNDMKGKRSKIYADLRRYVVVE